MDYVAKHVPGGVPAMLEAMSDDVRTFFSQLFLAGTWYDVFPLVAAGHDCARLCGMTFEAFVAARSRYQADVDINGIYRLLLKMLSAETVATRIPRLMQTYFDFGATEATVVSSGKVRARISGMPVPMANWYAMVAHEYFLFVLQVAGARNLVVRQRPQTPGKPIQGIETSTLEWELSWSE